MRRKPILKNDKSPTSLRQMYIIMKYEIYRAWGSKKIIVGIIISSFVSSLLLIFLPLYFAYSEGVSINILNWKIYIGTEIIALNYLAVLFPILFCVNALSCEYENNSGSTIFIQPLYRETLFFGKLLSSIIIISLLNLLNYLFITICYIIFYFSVEALILIFFSFLILTLASIAYISITFLINSIINRGHLTSLIFFFGVFLLGLLVMPKFDEYLLGPIYSIPYNSFSSLIVLDPGEYYYAFLTGIHPNMYPNTWISIIMLTVFILGSIIAAGIYENMKELK